MGLIRLNSFRSTVNMDILLEVNENPDDEWDNRVLDANGSIYQTTSYAEYLKESLGVKNLFLVAKKNKKIIGQLILSSGPLFSKYLKDRHKLLFRFFSKHFKTYTFIKGPIILDSHYKKEIYAIFLDYLDKEAKKAYMAQDLSLPIGESEEVYSLFDERHFYRDSWGTIIINTTQPEEVLWKNLSKTRRNLIRRGMSQNLDVKEAKTKEDYDIVLSIIRDMSERNGIFMHPETYYYNLFRILSDKERIKTFFIEKEGKGIATISVYLLGNQAIQTLVAESNQGRQDKINGIDFLEWYIIKWTHDNSYTTYDLAGIRPESKDKKDINLREYKDFFGGKEIHYPYFSKFYSKSKSFLMNPIKKIAKKFKIGF